MSNEEFVLRILDGIDSKYIAEVVMTEEESRKGGQAYGNQKLFGLFAAAAVALLCMFGIWRLCDQFRSEKEGKEVSELIAALTSVCREEKNTMIGKQITVLPVNNRVAHYRLVFFQPTAEQERITGLYSNRDYQIEALIGESIGKLQIRDAQNWYRLKGKDDLRYLISETFDGRYAVWEFVSFQATENKKLEEIYPDCRMESYTLQDILTSIYQVNSASDIASIELETAEINEGSIIAGDCSAVASKNVIQDRRSVSIILDILCGVGFYDPADADISSQVNSSNGKEQYSDQIDGSQGDGGSAGRIVINSVNGTRIVGMEYYSRSGILYDDEGILYKKLSAGDAALINQYFCGVYAH